MNPHEKQSWDQFCKSGLVADYLEYRNAVGFGQKAPEPLGKEEDDAVWNPGGGASSPELGGI